MKKITRDFLVQHKACQRQLELFTRWYPEGIEITPENAQEAFSRGLDVPWIFRLIPLTVVLENSQGKYWYHNGKPHREDGPAVILRDGTRRWYRDGKPHREDGPAAELASGTKYWYRDGLLHREDGPAVVRADGTKRWYCNDLLHREDGPAVVYADGIGCWYQNGIFQRRTKKITK